MSILATSALLKRILSTDHTCGGKFCCSHIIIKPFSEQAVRSNSIDVTLGPTLKVSEQYRYGAVYDYKKGNVSYASWDLNLGPYILRPHRFVLGVLAQFLYVPADLSCTLEGRSSVGRFGLFVQNAGRVESGWKGNLTLELYNAEEFDILLTCGMPIGQLVFSTLEGEATPYSEMEGSKYHGDTQPEPSKLHLEYK